MIPHSLSLIFLVSVLSVATCHLGIDIPTPEILTTDQAKCLLANNFDTLYIRAYRSSGTVDPNVLTNIANAVTAGFKDISVYIFPCVPCGNPRKQVQDTILHLGKAPYVKLWLDIEERAWTKDKSFNQQFVTELLDEMKKCGKPTGVYASLYQWDQIVGKDWEGAKDHLLWYPRWDHNANFDDFKPFGGWTKPYAKQYEPNGNICGMPGTDLDYKP